MFYPNKSDYSFSHQSTIVIQMQCKNYSRLCQWNMHTYQDFYMVLLPNLKHRQNFYVYILLCTKAPKDEKSTYYNRNPVCLAKESKRMIDSCEVKNQSEFAKILCASQVRICQALNLLNLDDELMRSIAELDNPISTRIISLNECWENILNTRNRIMNIFRKKYVDV